MRNTKRIIIFLLAALILTGMWSSRAWPGEFFYTYKVSVNAPAMKLLRFTADSKGMFEVDQLGARAREAEFMLMEQRFGDEAQTVWTSSFIGSALAVQLRVTGELEGGSAVRAYALAANAHAVLDAYFIALEYIVTPDNSGEDLVAQNLSSQLSQFEALVESTRKKVAQSYNAQEYISSVEGQISDTKKFIDAARSRFYSERSTLPKSGDTEGQRLIHVMESQLQDAVTKQAQDLYSESSMVAADAYATARRLHVLVDVLTYLN